MEPGGLHTRAPGVVESWGAESALYKVISGEKALRDLPSPSTNFPTTPL